MKDFKYDLDLTRAKSNNSKIQQRVNSQSMRKSNENNNLKNSQSSISNQTQRNYNLNPNLLDLNMNVVNIAKQPQNKLTSLKMNLFVNNNSGKKSENSSYLNNNIGNVSRLVRSPLIAENLRSKLSDMYNDINTVIGDISKTNYINYQHDLSTSKLIEENFNKQSGGSNKIQAKKQEVMRMLDDLKPKLSERNKKKEGWNSNIDRSKRALMRSGSADYISVKNKNYGYDADSYRYDNKIESKYYNNDKSNNDNENTERILKMKNKLEKLIDGEFMITPLIEDDLFNFVSPRGLTNNRGCQSSIKMPVSNNNPNSLTSKHKKTSSMHFQQKKDDINFNFNLNSNINFNFNDLLEKEIESREKEKKESSNNSDLKKIVDMDFLSFEDKCQMKSPQLQQINFLGVDHLGQTAPSGTKKSPVTGIKLDLSELNKVKAHDKTKRTSSVEKIEKLDQSSNHKRTRSALAESLPFKKEIINLDEINKNISLLDY